MIKKREETAPTVKDFFVEILRDLHDKAADYGWAAGGMIYAKELLPFGQEYLLEMLNDREFQQKFGLNAVSYYLNIGCKAFCAGVFYADCWYAKGQKQAAGISSEYLLQREPYALALAVLSDKSAEDLDDFLHKIFEYWLECMDPYWDMSDGRDYIFHGLLVFYQLGISERLKALSARKQDGRQFP